MLYSSTPPLPVRIEDFIDHVLDMHRDSDYQFSHEYSVCTIRLLLVTSHEYSIINSLMNIQYVFPYSEIICYKIVRGLVSIPFQSFLGLNLQQNTCGH